ncbi:hypothetical protein CCM_05564 [Cordyceps militaris CM01]|uniref:Hydrophobin n=2 Tax=Cordyceps militaris TaxID=73501 RepID=G3JKC2_CORMM|nr:uncharacterized protein CCM_05564 [Cordyceps militaris CM01]ATY59089.1 hypothetical protein A9K55_002940 [Cordyceps militaris]EGX91406.1 hypothetical protein CCM_05564 [Cordyceps militaris CM01]
MQFSLATIAMAAAVVAAPTGGNTGGGACSINGGTNNGQVSCCSSTLPVVSSLLCGILSGSCSSGQSVYCCDATQTGLINIGLNNCGKIL